MAFSLYPLIAANLLIATYRVCAAGSTGAGELDGEDATAPHHPLGNLAPGLTRTLLYPQAITCSAGSSNGSMPVPRPIADNTFLYAVRTGTCCV